MSERTLPALFEESVRAFPENVLIWEKTGRPVRADHLSRACSRSSIGSPRA